MDTRLLRPWDFLGKSTGVGCHFLLQGIFPTQGSNLGLPYCRQTLYRLSHQGSLSLSFVKHYFKNKIKNNRESIFWWKEGDKEDGGPGKGCLVRTVHCELSGMVKLGSCWEEGGDNRKTLRKRERKLNLTCNFAPESVQTGSSFFSTESSQWKQMIAMFWFFFFSCKAGLNLKQNINSKRLSISLPIPTGIESPEKINIWIDDDNMYDNLESAFHMHFHWLFYFELVLQSEICSNYIHINFEFWTQDLRIIKCSCLENPRDRGAWWAAVSGVAQSRTRLKWLSSKSTQAFKIEQPPYWFTQNGQDHV